VKPRSDQRLSDHVALGVLTRTFGPQLVDAVLADTGRLQQRVRLLPARLMVYFVLALALFADVDYAEVMRQLVEGLSWRSGWKRSWTVPSTAAISVARARLGAAPLVELFDRGCVPVAGEQSAAAFWRGLRLVGMDGTTLDVPDTVENVAEFGRPGSGRGEGVGAFPQLRMVALAECGTHACFAAAIGSYRTGETTLAAELAGKLAPDMLVFADRNFLGHPLLSTFIAGGGQVCWRAKKNKVLPVLERYPDGSYRSEIVASGDKRARAHVITVRVIEYTVTDPGRPEAEERYRLVTTLLDHAAYPAEELAGLYAERWEFESLLDEMKTHQRGPRVVLRSKSPEMARQEVYGYLACHYAIRALIASAADDAGLDPDRVSFTGALRAARRSVRAGIGVAERAITSACHTATAETTGQLLTRRLRAAARVVKRKMSGYPVKRPAHRSWPQPTLTPGQAVQILVPP
jgi:hypothetical protein